VITPIGTATTDKPAITIRSQPLWEFIFETSEFNSGNQYQAQQTITDPIIDPAMLKNIDRKDEQIMPIKIEMSPTPTKSVMFMIPPATFVRRLDNICIYHGQV
jgi:hypothetical protein